MPYVASKRRPYKHGYGPRGNSKTVNPELSKNRTIFLFFVSTVSKKTTFSSLTKIIFLYQKYKFHKIQPWCHAGDAATLLNLPNLVIFGSSMSLKIHVTSVMNVRAPSLDWKSAHRDGGLQRRWEVRLMRKGESGVRGVLD